MINRKRERPAQDDVNRLRKMLRGMDENRRRLLREASEFKPGDLTQEEEEFVRREGLNALNYIPQKTLQKQSESLKA